jgi:hypothetical protein
VNDIRRYSHSTFEIPFDKKRNEDGSEKCVTALSGIPELRNTISKFKYSIKIQLRYPATVLLGLLRLQAHLEKLKLSNIYLNYRT